MATVYLARQTDLDRYVALKELSAALVSDPTFAERFTRESRMAASLSHPNVVIVHEFFELEDVPSIAMEYLERGSLRPWVGRLTLAQIAGVLEGVLAGLSHAEERGIAHRDLKPENVMVTREGGVKIADFGIAKAWNRITPSAAALTATGAAIGTPTYMAPEQAMGKEVGPATDLYSTGVMAYELILGTLPFDDAETPMAILLRHVSEPPPPPLSVDPNLDPRLAAWIEGLLEKDPSARPSSALAAWHELEEIIIALLGPRWRREARLVDPSTESETARQQTSARFHDATVQASPDTRPRSEPPRDELVTSRSPDEAPADVEGRPAEPTRLAPPSVHEQHEHPVPDNAAQTEQVEREAPDGAAPELVGSSGRSSDLARTQRPARVDDEPAHRDWAQKAETTRLGEALSDAGPPAEVAPVEPQEALPKPPASPTVSPTRPALSADAHAATYDAPPGSRRRWLPIAAVLGVLGAGGVAAALLVGRSASSETSTGTVAKTTPQPAAPEPRPSATEQLQLASGGQALYLTAPNGHVLRLDPATLRPQAQIADPAGPLGVAVNGRRAYVADRGTLTVYDSRDLTPIRSQSLPNASLLVAGTEVPNSVVTVQSAGPNASRLCEWESSHPTPGCVALAFSVTGVGTGPGRVFVANGSAGTVETALPEGSPERIRVGRSPRGHMLTFRNHLYVPVDHGVAIVDLATRRLVRTVSLPGTPTDLGIVASSGLLFATLYAQGDVAIVDIRLPTSSPSSVHVGPKPVALVASRAGVYVVTAGNATITRLDPATGKRAGSVRIAALGRRTRPVVALAPRFSARGLTVTATVPLTGGRLDSTSLVARDRAIGDGEATLELWQGGISTSAGSSKTFHGLTVSIAAASGRLVVKLSSAGGAFKRLAVRRAESGAMVLTVTKPSPPPQQTTTAPSPSPTPTPTPSPTPTPTPTPAPPAPPAPPITVG